MKKQFLISLLSLLLISCGANDESSLSSIASSTSEDSPSSSSVDLYDETVSVKKYEKKDDSPSLLPNAKWIWNEETDHNMWLNLRKNFTLDKVGDTSYAEIAVENKYQLYVNGRQVIFDGGVKRGYSPTDGYFDKVDISSYLIAGNNSIAIKAWFWGSKDEQDEGMGVDVSYNNVPVDVPGLIFALQSGDYTLYSDDSWKVERDDAFKNDTLEGYSIAQPNLRFPEYNVYYDANDQKDVDFYSVDFDDSSWNNATVNASYGDAPFNALHERPIPLLKDYGLKDYVNSAEIINHLTTQQEEITMDVPYNAQLTPYLKVKATQRSQIFIKTENTDSTKSVNTTYITSPNGEQEFESPAWISGQHITYIIPSGVTILSLKYRETGYDTEIKGSFSINDSFYDSLWNMGARTQYVCMRDTFMDCPDRERSQWTGDAVLQMRQMCYSMTPSTYSLYKKMMSQKIEWQKVQTGRKKNRLPTVMPITNMLFELPAQEMAGIVSVYDYYLYTGDSDILYDVYDGFEAYLKLWSIDTVVDLVNHKTGGDVLPNWEDTGNRVDSDVQENALYYWCCNTMQKIGTLIGKDTSFYEQRMNTIKQGYEALWHEGIGYATDTEYLDERGNAFAVLSGLAPKERYATIINLLKNNFLASTYTENYVLMAMCEMGYVSDALERMKFRFSDMVNANLENGYTTLWEYFTKGMGTYNHAWSAGSLFLMSKYVGGIQSTRSGFDSYQIKPDFSHSDQVEVSTETIKGTISLSAVKKEDSVEMNLTAVDGIATIVLPSTKGEVTIDGTLLSKAENTIDDIARYESFENGYLTFKIRKAGSHQISVK